MELKIKKNLCCKSKSRIMNIHLSLLFIHLQIIPFKNSSSLKSKSLNLSSTPKLSYLFSSNRFPPSFIIPTTPFTTTISSPNISISISIRIIIIDTNKETPWLAQIKKHRSKSPCFVKEKQKQRWKRDLDMVEVIWVS